MTGRRGAATAWRLAISHPQRCRSLTVLSVGHPGEGEVGMEEGREGGREGMEGPAGLAGGRNGEAGCPAAQCEGWMKGVLLSP
jgi:pimeloyl-ACP methyl ester carboxylesterase